MARKTAIRTTNEEQRLAEAKKDAAKDAAQFVDPPTVLELMRAARDMMTDEELIDRCRSAAVLELVGQNYSTDDRLDCASDMILRIFSETHGAPPRRQSGRISWTRLRGDAANYRRSLDAARKRDTDNAESDAAEHAAGFDAIADVIAFTDLPAGYREARETQTHETRIRAAQSACETLGVALDGNVYAVLYQWLADTDGVTAAGAHGMTAGAWRVRINRGGKILRGAYPNPADLLSKLIGGAPLVTRTIGTAPPETYSVAGGQETYSYADRYGEVIRLAVETLTYATADQSRPAASHAGTWSGKLLRDIAGEWRQGTDNGNRATRHATPEEARAACKLKRQRPAPKRAAQNRQRARSGYDVAGTSGKYRTAGIEPDAAMANARRDAARAASAGRVQREQSVNGPAGRTKRGNASAILRRKSTLDGS